MAKEMKGKSERNERENERKRESIEGEGIRVKRRRKIGKKTKVSIFYIFFF